MPGIIIQKNNKEESFMCPKRFFVLVLAMAFIAVSCARYERQVVPFQLPSVMPNAAQVSGATIAAKAFHDKKEAEAAFGFDVIGSGVYPVQVIFDNKGQHPIEVVPNQTFMTDVENKTWPILDASLAYDRIHKKTEFGKIAPEATTAGLLGGAAGAVVGAAIGIVAGHSVGEFAAKGAAVGAAGGILAGGAKGVTDTEPGRQIREDIQQRSLENRAVKPSELAYGFIFFPGEAKKAKDLRLQIREADTGKTFILNFGL
jgi:hypothetical protein